MAKKTDTKKKVSKKTDVDSISELSKNLDKLTEVVARIQSNLEIVNSNSQYACDEIDQLRPKIDRALGRMGL